MDAMRYLETEDPYESHLMAKVAERHQVLRNELADEDADRIAKAVWGAVSE